MSAWRLARAELAATSETLNRVYGLYLDHRNQLESLPAVGQGEAFVAFCRLELAVKENVDLVTSLCGALGPLSMETGDASRDSLGLGIVATVKSARFLFAFVFY